MGIWIPIAPVVGSGVLAMAESFEWGGWRFEVMDMERNRVDEVLAKRI